VLTTVLTQGRGKRLDLLAPNRQEHRPRVGNKQPRFGGKQRRSAGAKESRGAGKPRESSSFRAGSSWGGGKAAAKQARSTPVKKRKHKPGVLALKEVRKYQKTVGPVLPKRPFGRLVREVPRTSRL
jgi:type IV secretory pathway TrbL component